MGKLALGVASYISYRLTRKSVLNNRLWTPGVYIYSAGHNGTLGMLSGNYAVVDTRVKTVVMFSRIYDKVHHMHCRDEEKFMRS